MNTSSLTVVLILLGITAGAAWTMNPEAESRTSEKISLGVFDSRAVTLAYVASDPFQEKLQQMHEELAEAKESGNEERVQELEAMGPAMQREIHRQGFSTWPIDNILELVEDDLAEVADGAGVDAVVCKWDIVYAKPEVAFVDVTAAMVELFDPDEATLQRIEELLKQPPVPLEDLREMDDH